MKKSRQERNLERSKVPFEGVKRGVPLLKDLIEGVVSYRLVNGTLVEYIRYGNRIFSREFNQVGSPPVVSSGGGGGGLEITEGTFTPIIEGNTTAGSYTYSRQDGYYRRIGDIVFYYARIIISSYTTAYTGRFTVANMPYDADYNLQLGHFTSQNLPQANNMHCYPRTAGNELQVVARNTAAATFAYIGDSSMPIGSGTSYPCEINVTGFYTTDDAV